MPLGHAKRRKNWTAPAGRGIRFLVAQNFGKVRRVKARNVWEIDVRPHGRFRSVPLQGSKPLRFTTQALAQQVLDLIRAEIAAGKSEWAAVAPYLPRAASTLNKIVERYISDLQERVEAGELAPRTIERFESYANAGGHFSWLYEFSVYEITTGHLKDWNSWLRKRSIHQNTRRHVLNDMRTIFRWLYGREELERVPEFPALAQKKTVPNIIDVNDQEEVLEAIPEALRGAHILAVEEVFRPGELRGLNVTDYNFRTRTLTLQNAMDGDTNAAERKSTKEEDVRVRQVTDRLADWLEKHIAPEERVNGKRPLFVNPRARTAPQGGITPRRSATFGRKRQPQSVSRRSVPTRGVNTAPSQQRGVLEPHATNSWSRGDTRIPGASISTPRSTSKVRRRYSGWCGRLDPLPAPTPRPR